MLDLNHTIQLAQDYVNFKLQAKSSSGHGIHSPFIFDFVRNVIYPKGKCPELDEIEWYRDWQIETPISLKNSNYGAGSSIETDSISLGKLIKHSSVSPKFGFFLYRLAKWIGAKSILELGTSVGISTIYLAGACPHAKIITLEGDKQRASFAQHTFDFLGCNNIQLLEGDFDTTLETAFNEIPKFDLIFFDGNHYAEPTLRYFKLCLEKKHHNSVFVFDDIRWSDEMFKAWQVISQHKKVTVSIDLFSFGVAFFRNGMPKQHFTINF